jgi:hypothetical protein
MDAMRWVISMPQSALFREFSAFFAKSMLPAPKSAPIRRATP